MKKKRHYNLRQNRANLLSKVSVVFEDEVVIVVDKPAGLLTVATDTEKHRTVYALLFDHVKSKPHPEKIFIVHRLDREASGLLVFAKTERAKHSLQDQFKNHAAGRSYLAVVEGKVRREAGTIRSYLAENAAHRVYSTGNPKKGKLAVTHFRVLNRSSQQTLIEVLLESGRKHQIRIHMSEEAHPILGDKAYGSRRNPLHRLALHATQLTFRHPRTNKAMEFNSPCPASFTSLVR